MKFKPEIPRYKQIPDKELNKQIESITREVNEDEFILKENKEILSILINEKVRRNLNEFQRKKGTDKTVDKR